MHEYEKLITQAQDEGAVVLELNLKTNKKCGKYLDNIIIVNSNLTDTEKYEIIAEELGHHRKTTGNITNQDNIVNLKAELTARRESYDIMLKPEDFIRAIKSGARNTYEASEFLNISEDVLLKIIEYWKEIYGLGIEIDGYYLKL